MSMRTTRHPLHHLLPLVGTGFVLVNLLGCLALPTASVAGFDPSAYYDDQERRDYWGYRGQRDYWGYRGQRDYWDHRDYRPYWRPRYELPDRYTIHKGKKCQLRCERIWGTRDYRCREYRC